MDENTEISDLENVDLSVGLHTCGPLSKIQFDHAIKAGIT